MGGVSVVIVNWNGLRYLEGCLASLGEAAEVIVVDNGSGDGSVDYIRRAWPRVRVVEAGRNIGFSAANNLGTAASTMPYVLFLNNDTVVRAGAITAMRQALENDASVGAVGARLENASGIPQPRSAGALPSLASEARRVLWPAAVRARREAFDFDRSQDVDFVCGAAIMLPRVAIDEVGGWPEDYYFYAEDAEVCRNLRDHGRRIRFESTARIVHFHGGSGKQRGPRAALRAQLLGHRSLNMHIRRHDGWASGVLHWLLYPADLFLRPLRRLAGRRHP